MRRWISIVAAIVFAAALLGPTSSAGTSGGGETFTVVSTILRIREVDASPRGPSVGDALIFKDTLWTEDGSEQVGVDFVECTVHFGSALLCDVAFRIDGRGQIAASGFSNPAATSFSFPVVGGTGDFQDVRGQVHVEFTSQDTAILTFDLQGTTA